MKIIVDKHVSDYDLIERTWKERLFSMPWRPFKKFRSVFNPKFYTVGDSIICSPRGEKIVRDARMRSPAFHSAMSYADIHDFDK